MDFFQVSTREGKRGEDKGVIEVFPDFIVGKSKDLMVRGKSFFAIFDEATGLWSTDEYDVQRLVDAELDAHAAKLKAEGVACKVKHLRSFGNNGWAQFRKFVSNVSDNSHDLDMSLTFSDTPVKKNDYVSKRLPYPLTPGDYSAWDEIVGTLYSEEERAKIEWAIGAIVSGDSKKIQKFLVFYGNPGTGKGTVLEIIHKLFEPYTTVFDAKALVGANNAFATEPFKNNPLVAIQFDGDLSNIQDNTKLNQIISHEKMSLNEKYKPMYNGRMHAFLLLGSNKPVKISDAKSGLIRRLIDVNPSGNLIPVNRYHTLVSQVDFELGAIAHHCLEVYRKMGKNFYSGYRPVVMMLQTDIFFNFIEAKYDIFKDQDGVTLNQAYEMYKDFCADSGIDKPLPKYKIRQELTSYFEEFKDRHTLDDGTLVRSYFLGFTAVPFKAPTVDDDVTAFSLVMEETKSIFDEEFADQPAQYGKADETPEKYWTDAPRLIRGEMRNPKPSQVVSTVLSDLDTSKLHFVKVPENHIVIDFDLKDENGNKSLERNLEAASTWPPTYAERSKSGEGVHLHYIYDGDVHDLRRAYDDGIEIKVFSGDASLRRRLSKCNNVPVATINSGLPLKEKKVLPSSTIQSEKGLRDLIARNLRKEIHPGTKPSVDFIWKILDDAHKSGMPYDVSDLKNTLYAFANNSTNHAVECLKMVQTMKLKSDESSADILQEAEERPTPSDTRPITFYDVEVFPNLFVICWKHRGSDTVTRMINPQPHEVQMLIETFLLVGFYNRNYDNHIIYARAMGYTLEQLFRLSQKLTDNKNKEAGKAAMFGEAFGLSYADIHDFSSIRQSLKKWEIDLGIHHVELNLPWDQPVPEDRWLEVADYCANDVEATEAVFEDRQGDFMARQILADLSGLTVNDTTAKHTARIIFGKDKNPQSAFVYTDLSRDFPGYKYDAGKSTYRGEVVGEGGLVRAKPGMYFNVALLDIASMHPTSINQLNLFGEYTPNFWALVEARLALKRKDYEAAGKMLGGRLAPFVEKPDATTIKALSDALKLAINMVYGHTSAKFDNPFRDKRNKDNIVAKRGALFMIDLMFAIEEQGFTVAHIKTDSVKIPEATPEIIEFVKQFGEKYGYVFEHEATYDKMCLVNDAVYIARQDICNAPVWEVVDETMDEANYVSNVEGNDCVAHWTAVGAQFQHPYVFKKLFSKADIELDDLCETKTVLAGAMYLDFDADIPMAMTDTPVGQMRFIGRSGRFVPVVKGSGGGVLYRVNDDKKYAVTGTKGYFWIEAEMADKLEDVEIDMEYFEHLAHEARKAIEEYGSFEDFVA